MDLNMRKILIADGKPIIKLDPHTDTQQTHTRGEESQLCLDFR